MIAAKRLGLPDIALRPHILINDRPYEVIGIIGPSVGILAILVVALTQGWTPVLEPLLVAGAPAIGLIVGALAGLQPSWKASSTQPTEALRR